MPSTIREVNITTQDSPAIDAFGRWRSSSPTTIFDSKQLYDNQPLFWDESLETGSGISSSHSVNTASTTLTSTLNTAGKFTRQTFMRFNYQPGKSTLIMMTGVLDKSGGGTGVQRRIGQFDDNNGLFFEDNEGTVNVVRRTKASGSVVDNKVAQASWNLDVMDGTGPSGITIDWTKAQIFIIDYEWLGVGRVRFGLVVDGLLYYVHEMNNANSLSVVYMSTPNLPLRYQIETANPSAASSIECICSTVQSEGGYDKLGVLRHQDSGQISGLSSGGSYAALGIRLKSGYLGAAIFMEKVSAIATTTNDQFDWELLLNPTVAGTFTYSDVTNSAVQTAVGTSSNTVTGGVAVDGGFVTTSAPGTSPIENALRLGAAIDGTVDEMVLVINPITNTTIDSSLTWREMF